MKEHFKKLKIIRQILVLAIVFVDLVTFNPASLTEANDRDSGTVVSIEDCDITVTTYLAFSFHDDAAWMNARQLGKVWTEETLKVWNDPGFTYGDCKCPVHFEIVAKSLPRGEVCKPDASGKAKQPGWHCIDVVSGRERDPQVGWEPVNERGNIADATQTSGTYPSGFGEWTVWASGADAAHEFGHLMGLADEYEYEDTDGDGQGDTYKNNNPQDSGSPQSIMAQTWGEYAALQEHIDKIMGDAGITCPDKCCCGNGTCEANRGEECDPKANPTGCPAGKTCNNICKCVDKPQVTPICGDGYITKPNEECDPKAKPIGCKADEECVGCKCKKKEIEEPGPDEEEPEPEPEENPKMSTSTSSLHFITTGVDPIAEGSFNIKNIGSGTLSWNIVADLPPWLSASPISGSNNKTISVTANTGGMLPGTTLHHVISISSNGGNKTVDVEVKVN